MKVLVKYAPNSFKTTRLDMYFGRRIAVDASMMVYQFLSAVRDNDGGVFVDTNGETTSHIMGTFYRTIKMLSNGIKPVFVFDGKPPELKSGEVRARV